MRIRRRFHMSAVMLVAALIAAEPTALAQQPVAPASPKFTARPAPKLAPAAMSAPAAMPPNAPMQVQIARSSETGCEPACLEWVAAQGRIDHTTLGRFKSTLSKLGDRKLPILIHSTGGSVNEALAIGRLIRAKGLDVIVTRTTTSPLPPCVPKDAVCQKQKARGVVLGKPEARLSLCASSCAFILAAGVRRFVGPNTFVGVHQLKSYQVFARMERLYEVRTRQVWGVPVETQKRLVSERKVGEKRLEKDTDESTYQRIERYFIEMGVAASIIPMLRSAKHDSVYIMKPKDLRETRMATEFITGESLLLTAAPAPATIAMPGKSLPEASGLCMNVAGYPVSCTESVSVPPTPPPSPAVVPSATVMPGIMTSTAAPAAAATAAQSQSPNAPVQRPALSPLPTPAN